MASFKQLLRGTVMALALSTLCVVGASAANVGVGTVTADALRMRSEASTDASILATAQGRECGGPGGRGGRLVQGGLPGR